ncbi:MAG: GDP-mannose 4,6-dehydratase [Candidatus Fischerbacteria bacterium RBG_13_37_8]|uniref:GDP-mannose 4,6-dehydratase n=1 Tax=Candidatus Fischerbacteria bacterium RBG_13_37_8 TaxID=1817863 RepID=A0A1F5VH55_9BACT|nr:MAG: GDP-mannose 4,6-dehydratase [Candidatus Fischerbacteria bacterium RBG_13_37_8]
MKVLITGITGFAGSHLADYILKEKTNVELHGIKRWRSRMENIIHIEKYLQLHEADLRDASSVLSLIEYIKPDYIFHLAAQSFVPASWKTPSETITTNINGQVNIFEAVRYLNLHSYIQIACSSEEYGLVLTHELPIKETNPLRPLSPYAVSKVGQDYLGYQYFMSYKMNIVRTRGFNHTGPRRGDVFVTSNFAKQIAEIELGLKEPVIFTGNLEAKRDFTDVRDMVKAYWLSLEKGEPGEVYNISSGQAYSIQEIIDKLLQLASVKVEIKTDPGRLRPSDVPVLLGDNTKFKQQTGWEPTIPFHQTLQDLLSFWREKLKTS